MLPAGHHKQVPGFYDQSSLLRLPAGWGNPFQILLAEKGIPGGSWRGKAASPALFQVWRWQARLEAQTMGGICYPLLSSGKHFLLQS